MKELEENLKKNYCNACMKNNKEYTSDKYILSDNFTKNYNTQFYNNNYNKYSDVMNNDYIRRTFEKEAIENAERERMERLREEKLREEERIKEEERLKEEERIRQEAENAPHEEMTDIYRQIMEKRRTETTISDNQGTPKT